MRNLWLLLQRNAFTLAFIALMAVSLSVLLRNDGAARSSWFKQTGAISYMIDHQRHGWSNYLRLAEQNAELAEENANLRSRLLSMDMATEWVEDTVRHWTVRSGMLIKGPDGKPRSPSIATPGLNGGIETGMGVLSGGAAFGTVEEVGEDHCRILTLMHSGTSWSCRIGRNGPVASLGWDGMDMGLLQLKDVPRHVQAVRGDSIFTSGYDLRFPPDVMMGTIFDVERQSGADFMSVSVVPAVDFKSSRHLDFLVHQADSERTALSSTEWQP
jgi:rod shape-determining protein MreC